MSVYRFAHWSENTRQRPSCERIDQLFVVFSFCLLLVGFGFSILIYLFFGTFSFAFYRNAQQSLPYTGHALFGIFAFALWSIQIFTGIFRNNLSTRGNIHRKFGRPVFYILLLYILSSIALAIYLQYGLDDTVKRSAYPVYAIVFLAIVILGYLLAAMKQASRGRIDEHRLSMIFAYNALCTVIWVRVVALIMHSVGLDLYSFERVLFEPYLDPIDFQELQTITAVLIQWYFWCLYAARRDILSSHPLKMILNSLPILVFPIALIP